MKKLTTYFLIVHIVMLLITGGGMWFIVERFFPYIMIDYYIIIPLFFLLMGILFILQFRRTPINKPKKMVNVYMMMRMIKVCLSAILMVLYWFLDKAHIRNFTLLFIIFYLINLIWETYIYMRIELYFKYKNKQLKKSGEDPQP